jgi:hypothetical protein
MVTFEVRQELVAGIEGLLYHARILAAVRAVLRLQATPPTSISTTTALANAGSTI